MKKYELMTISNISLGEDGVQTLSNSVKDLISTNKGKVMDSESWGKRKFSYRVNKDQEGFYEIIEFELEPQKLESLKSKLGFMDGLVRYLVTAGSA